MFLKLSRAVTTGCTILGQTGSILLQKEIFAPTHHKISKMLSESELLNIKLDNFGPNWINYSCLEGNFLGKLTDLNIESHHTATFQNSQKAYHET